MEEFDTSEFTMIAEQKFYNIVSEIQASCLNYNMQLSPFSASISLKKSLIRDRLGNVICSKYPANSKPLLANISLEKLLSENQNQTQELNCLKVEHEKLVSEFTEANDTIIKLKLALKERDNLIQDLQLSNNIATESVNKLNTLIKKNGLQFEKEKRKILEEHKIEVRSWKNDLGKARRRHLRLEKKFTLFKAAGTEAGFHCQEPVGNESSSEDPACSECSSEDQDQDEDLISDFSGPGIPLSLTSHWPLPNTHYIESLGSLTSLRAHYASQDGKINDLSALCSLRSHYVRLPNPGKAFSSLEHLEYEFKELLRTSKHQGCRQS